MPNQRVERAAKKLSLSDSGSGKLEEALDVTRHLPLVLIGDKVLALVIALAYHNAHFSNRQITNQIDRIANNNSLIDAGKGIGLQDLLLCSGRNAPDKVPCDHLSSNLEPLKEPKVGAAIKKAPRTHFSARDFSPKVLANTVEAIIGAAFFEGGIQCAADVVRKLNIDPLDRDGNPQSGWASKWARIESTVQSLGKCPLEPCS